MAGFEIEQVDPGQYKDQIIEFWDKYLPGTDAGRFDWMQNNTAGSSVWLLAFDSKTREIAGMISIMLRTLYIKGDLCKAGIVGDLMISENCRVFGPALPLLKAAVEAKKRNGIDFLYTVPNQASMKLTERVGFEEKIVIKHFMRPLKTKTYLHKKLGNRFISSTISVLLDMFLYLYSKISCVNFNCNFEVVAKADKSFMFLWDKLIKNNKYGVLSEHGVDSLNWRYSDNPKYSFSFLKYTSKKTGELLGYIVYCISNDKILIYDVVSESSKQASKLLSKLVCIAYECDIQSVYFTVSQLSTICPKLKKSLFIDADGDVSVLMHDENNYDFSHWEMIEGDRNI